jgi:hypothetical protein
MRLDHENFTMSFAQARDIGIDYRDFQKVNCLPEGIQLTAVAGVWGDYQNIRCLFVDENGNQYMRNIKGGGGVYNISELGLNAQNFEVGQNFKFEQ